MNLATMSDLVCRVVRHPADYLPVLHTHRLTLQERVQESEHIYSFIFTPDAELQWLSGQHGIFTLEADSAREDNRRIFSIASAITEGHLRISTIISDTPSVFKSALRSMDIGQTINMRGPIGEFHLTDETKHVVGVVGGIGITPLRAMIKELVDTGRTDVTMELLYGSAPDARTFAAELEEWSQLFNLSVIYPAGKEDLQAKLQAYAEQFGNTATYYISGSPGMIGGLRTLLKHQQIRNIINDPFKGYG